MPKRKVTIDPKVRLVELKQAYEEVKNPVLKEQIQNQIDKISQEIK